MPVYIRFDGVDGSVRGSENGGVWKTTNFLTADQAGPMASRPGVGVLKSADGGSTWAVSRISLSPNGGGVDGRDAAAGLKVEQLVTSARSGGPMGRIYVATDSGVYQRPDVHGRLLVGSDQGVWRSGGGANKFNGSNNLRQIGLAAHTTSVEIIVTDALGTVVNSHRLSNVSVTGTSGTFTLTFNGQTTGG